VIVQIAEIPTDTRVAAVFTVEVGIENRDRIGLEVLGGFVEGFVVERGSRSLVARRPLPVGHRWLMIRHDGTDLRLATSPDGWGWIGIGTPVSHDADFSSAIVEIGILVAMGGSSSAAQLRYDNVNLPPPRP
jgi:hypothetical protein